MAKKKQRKRPGNPLGERGRQMAYFWLSQNLNKEVAYKDLCAYIVQKFNVSKRTAKNWIKHVRDTLADGGTIHPVSDEPLPEEVRSTWVELPKSDPPLQEAKDGTIAKARIRLADVDAERWEQVYQCMLRIEQYRDHADLTRVGGSKDYYQAERLALDYLAHLTKLLGWHSMPPDRLMSQPEVRAKAIIEIERGMNHMRKREVERILKAGQKRLNELEAEKAARDAQTPESESAEQHYQTEVTAVM